jgi:hypothetical protein
MDSISFENKALTKLPERNFIYLVGSKGKISLLLSDIKLLMIMRG